jgi:hypothetical protein
LRGGVSNAWQHFNPNDVHELQGSLAKSAVGLKSVVAFQLHNSISNIKNIKNIKKH